MYNEKFIKMNFNELANKAHTNAVNHGFWKERWSNEHCLMLIITEHSTSSTLWKMRLLYARNLPMMLSGSKSAFNSELSSSRIGRNRCISVCLGTSKRKCSTTSADQSDTTRVIDANAMHLHNKYTEV